MQNDAIMDSVKKRSLYTPPPLKLNMRCDSVGHFVYSIGHWLIPCDIWNHFIAKGVVFRMK